MNTGDRVLIRTVSGAAYVGSICRASDATMIVVSDASMVVWWDGEQDWDNLFRYDNNRRVDLTGEVCLVLANVEMMCRWEHS